MRALWRGSRSVVLWTLAWLFFVLVVLFMLVAVTLLGQRGVEWMLRPVARGVLFLAGARLRVLRAPGYDPTRTCFYAVNHVNLFDPFVLYPAIPVLFRGLELESHFKIPFYGWMMKRFGNVPVPVERTPNALKRTYRLAGEALARGTNLIVFPEGGRTLDGRVQEFERGVFRMAHQLKVPIVPVSIVGAFRWNNKLSWHLTPSDVTVQVHEAVETEGLTRADLDGLRERVRAIVAAPVHADLDARPLVLPASGGTGTETGAAG